MVEKWHLKATPKQNLAHHVNMDESPNFQTDQSLIYLSAPWFPYILSLCSQKFDQ